MKQWIERGGRLALGAGSTPDEPQEFFVMPFTVACNAIDRMRTDESFRKEMGREFSRIFGESFEKLFSEWQPEVLE